MPGSLFFLSLRHMAQVSRYFIFLSFRGTAYHGWQLQPGKPTVQEVINRALSTLLSENINVTGAGRTDTGVHAEFFCAHFDSATDTLAGRYDLSLQAERFSARRYSSKPYSQGEGRCACPI